MLLGRKNDATLLPYLHNGEQGQVEAHQQQIAPPDDWVTQQVDAHVVTGEELALSTCK